MLNNNVTNEVATILYGEQLTLWDSLDEADAETAQPTEVASESAQAEQTAPEPVRMNAVTAKPLDDSHTLVVVVALPEWKPP